MKSLEKYLYNDLNKRQVSNKKAKVIFLYIFKNQSVNKISTSLRIQDNEVVKYLNNWEIRGFNSLKKDDYKIVSEKERIERSLIARIKTNKAKAILLNLQGMEIKEIAKQFSVSRQTVHSWKKDYINKGKNSLRDIRTRKTILGERDIKVISKILQESTDFDIAYKTIKQNLNKNFCKKTLKNFMSKFDIRY